MRAVSEIQKVLCNLPEGGETKYHLMTYEQGIEEALLWVLEEIPNEELSYWVVSYEPV